MDKAQSLKSNPYWQRRQLEKYLAYGHGINLAFAWHDSPQGYDHWSNIHYGLSLLTSEDREFLEWLLDDVIDPGEPDEVE